MPEYFVWIRPALVRVFEAENEQAAAEAFLELPATTKPEPGVPPDCFVQTTEGHAVPRADNSAVEFWAIIDDD